MSRIFPLSVLFVAACGTSTPSAPEPQEPAAHEPVAQQAKVQGHIIEAVYHSTVIVRVGHTVIWSDPWSQGDLAAHDKADIILITDIHPDHLDAEAIAAVSKEGTVIVAPEAVAAQLEGVDHVLANGENVTIGDITLEAVPMYNRTRGPEPGTVFHPKGRGNGYIIEGAGSRTYIAGDTECTDEMKALRNIHTALIPMNLPYTMPPGEAAECVASFEPTVAIPYHYGESDRSMFEEMLADSGVTVNLLEFYKGGKPSF